MSLALGVDRLRHLREHQNGIYTDMLLSGKLEAHPAEANARAREMFEQLVNEMPDDEGVTEELKTVDQVAWIQQMNSIRSRSTEIIRE